MFRQAGMSKQPMGILASSPELMTTAQQAMMNGRPVNAQSGMMTSLFPSPMTTTTTIKDRGGLDADVVGIQNETPLEVLKRKQEEKNKTIDTSLSEPKPNINDINKKIIDGGDKDNLFNVKKLRPCICR